MKYILLLSILILFSSNDAFAAKEKTKKIPYQLAQYYFVKNTVSDQQLTFPKITSQSVFNQLFGAATLMGKKGKPTSIDFSKQFVIAYIDQTSNQAVELSVASLTLREGLIQAKIARKSDASSNSARYRNAIILIVDKKYEHTIKLSCDNARVTSVEFKLANRYFVKNTVEDGVLTIPAIRSEEELMKYFGTAPTLGKDGEPTTIDFTNEYVLAVIDSITNEAPINLEAISLTKTTDQLNFVYSKSSQEKTGSEFRYLLLLVIPKQYDCTTTITEIK